MRRLAYFAAPFALATAAFVYCLSFLWGLACSAAALLALVVVLRYHRPWREKAAIALAGLCCGFLFCSMYSLFVLDPGYTLDGQTAELTATVCDYPRKTQYGCSVSADATIGTVQARTLLYLDEAGMTLKPGDQISLTAELHRTDRSRDGDRNLYYAAKGVQLYGDLRGEVSVTPCEETPLRFYPVVFSQRLRERIAACVPEDAAPLIQALLTGDKSNLSYAVRSDLSRAGVAHVVAISGMHVSILLGVLAFVLRKRRVLTALIGIPVVIFFVFSTGCSPSVVRAAAMQILYLIAPLLHRENDPPTSLCAALLLILLQNPYAIANTSFQLSFSAMAGILLVSGSVYRSLRKLGPLDKWLNHENRPKGRILRILFWLRQKVIGFLLVCMATTVGAQFSLPICALTFDSFSPYTFLSNPLILPAIFLCFVGGLVVLILSLIPGVGPLLGWVLAWPIHYVLLVSQGIAQLPFSSLPISAPLIQLWVIGACLMVLFGALARKKLLTCACIAGLLIVCVTLTWLDLRPQRCRMTVLDVGQGQCVLMLSPDLAAVYDCGGSYPDETGELAAEHLDLSGVRRLDALILSHYDKNHVGGVAQLLYRVRVDTLYLPDVSEDSSAREEIVSLAERYGIQIHYVTEQTSLPFSGGSLTVYPPVSTYDDNAASLCVLLESETLSAFLSGDMNTTTEKLMLRERQLPTVGVYVAGHHGSRSSSGMPLLETLQPRLVLISVGRNRYGLPSQEALARFAAIGATVWRTDEMGVLTVGR